MVNFEESQPLTLGIPVWTKINRIPLHFFLSQPLTLGIPVWTIPL